MIVRDGADTLERCLDSIKAYVDEIVVGIDSRTVDNSEEIARSYNASTFHFEWKDDFSYARNLVADHVTSDWIFVIDADDYLVSVDDSIIPPDEYVGANVSVKTGPGTGILSARIYKKGKAHYVFKIHEYLKFDEPRVTTLDIVMGHSRGKIVEPGRNLRILDDIMTEYPRYLFYYGRECIDSCRLEDGISALQKYIELSSYESEKLQAMVDIARAYFNMDRIKDARKYCLMAIELNQNFQPAYIWLGRIAYQRQEWELGVNWLEASLNLKPMHYVFDHVQMDTQFAWDHLSVCYFYLKDFEKGRFYLEKCLELEPDNERYKSNFKFFEEATS